MPALRLATLVFSFSAYKSGFLGLACTVLPTDAAVLARILLNPDSMMADAVRRPEGRKEGVSQLSSQLLCQQGTPSAPSQLPGAYRSSLARWERLSCEEVGAQSLE